MLKQGEIGVSHWIDHVQVQTDDFAGKLTTEERKAQFTKTRVKGPGDLKRYRDALDDYENLKGSCEKVEGADSVSGGRLGQVRKAKQGPATGAEGHSWGHEGLDGSHQVHAVQQGAPQPRRSRGTTKCLG